MKKTTKHSSEKRFKLWHKIVLALILGSLTGLFFGEKATILAPIGRLFINAISMIVIPVVFTSIVCSVMAISDMKTMGRVMAKTITMYVITMALATCIGMAFAQVLKPGLGLPVELVQQSLSANPVAADLVERNKHVTIADTISSIVPANVVAALANGDILPCIVFAFILGLAIVRVGPAARPVGDFFQGAMLVTFKATHFVLQFAPIGVFALIAQAVGTIGIEILKELSLLVITIYLGCFAVLAFIYIPVLMYNRLSPGRFFKKMLAPMSFAFSTGSSAATLPLTLETTQKQLGVSSGVAEFIVPLGATINMNGLSVYLGVAALFVANIFGVDLSMWQYAMIIMTSTLASIGAAGVPMSGIVVMSIVLGGAGLPIEAIALIAGVDRIIDMMTTTVNITGDALTAVVVGKSEGQLDKTVYNTPLK
jgi:Na+/H+-dicarboxylate symporter